MTNLKEPLVSAQEDDTRHQNNSNNIQSNISNGNTLYRWDAKKFFFTNFLLIGLLVALLISLVIPQPGTWIGAIKIPHTSTGLVSTINIVLIFVATGITLQTDEVKNVFRQPTSLIYGIIVICLITSLSGFVIAKLPFPHAYTVGFVTFLCQGTSTTSGISQTTQLKGDVALCIFLLVCTSTISVFTAPTFVQSILNTGSTQIHIDYQSLLGKLILNILIPVSIGKILRQVFRPIQKFADSNRKSISIFTNFNLILTIWQTLSKAQPNIVDQKWQVNLAIIVTSVITLSTFLAFNYVVGKYIFKFEEYQFKAVLLMCSQKQLPSTLAMLAYLPLSQYDQGLAVIPAVLMHVTQTILNSLLVSVWASNIDARERKQQQQQGYDQLEDGNNVQEQGESSIQQQSKPQGPNYGIKK